mmetsp:Transcript_17814/g.26265  ORF Transcript_17814/g.26265 Transcript_17814/m.26265 type:complete len:106 (-) Transcript_17814:431-748(-)
MEECANGMGGAKVRKCSSEGCANQVRNGGLCIKHGVPGKRKKCDWVGCEILLREEEYARSMGQNAKNVAKKDALKSCSKRRTVHAGSMVLTRRHALQQRWLHKSL